MLRICCPPVNQVVEYQEEDLHVQDFSVFKVIIQRQNNFCAIARLSFPPSPILSNVKYVSYFSVYHPLLKKLSYGR